LLLRHYLALIRLPNVFTAPPDVLVGYFAFVSPADANGIQLVGLMASSALLYISGIVFNDYFDIESDRKERPSRPLPSGKIKKENALLLAFLTLAAGNIIPLVTVGPASLIFSGSLSAIILAYNYRLKTHAVAGTLAMATARFFNVILGASPVLVTALFTDGSVAFADVQNLTLASASLFAYIVAIMTLSRKEVAGTAGKQNLAAIGIVFGLVIVIGVGGYLIGFQSVFLLFLLVFAAIMILTFRRYLRTSTTPPESIQKAIRNMVTSIVILDSVFVAGTADLFFGLATMVFIVPAFVLGKRMYVT
jgi:4-hydroxybenzoate polyprenyltransferase